MLTEYLVHIDEYGCSYHSVLLTDEQAAHVTGWRAYVPALVVCPMAEATDFEATASVCVDQTGWATR